MPVDVLDFTLLVLIGLVAGIFGGMLGIGGSVIMIPGMAILFHDQGGNAQHLFQAAAMVVNVAVALPATIRHYKAGTIRRDLFQIMLPATLIMIIVGVFVSNLFEGQILKKLFALFLIYVVMSSTLRLVRRQPDHPAEKAKVTIPRGGLVGGVMGFMGGLLGIGGGAIAVPLALVVCKLPLRQAISISASVMCITAGIGAALKIGTISEHGYTWTQPLVLAIPLIPAAVLGGFLGAGLTHRLPLTAVRIVFAIVMLIVAGRMAGLY